jgi:hypothetical protein
MAVAKFIRKIDESGKIERKNSAWMKERKRRSLKPRIPGNS